MIDLTGLTPGERALVEALADQTGVDSGALARVVDQVQSQRRDRRPDPMRDGPPLGALLVARGLITEESLRGLIAARATQPAGQPARPAGRPDGPLPSRIGDWRILGKLGEGAQATVFHARDAGGREVALKVIAGLSSAAEVERLAQEARRLQSLERPHVVRVLQVDIVEVAVGEIEADRDRPESQVLIATELVRGETLRETILGGEQPLPVLLERLVDVARGAAGAHEAGLVHRDLKPENVLVDRSPEGSLRARITDFGLALDLEAELRRTRSGELVGSPAYMAPEQLRGAIHEHGPATDVYALGAMLHELCAGHTPFFHAADFDRFRRQVEAGAPPCRFGDSELALGLGELCRRALAREPAMRPGAAAFAEELARWAALAGRQALASEGRGASPLGESPGEAETRVTAPKRARPAEPRPEPPRVGATQARTRLGEYEILAPLGAGGMGEVFKVRHRRLGALRAAKVLAADASPTARARFRREGRALATLQHRHIVGVSSIGEQDGRPFLIMELIEGRTLASLIADRTPPGLDADETCRILSEIAEGLDCAHRAGIVHRDVKPENIIVRHDGHAVLLDFGIARLEAAEDAEQRLTKSNDVVGTPLYMAPEQVLPGRSDAPASRIDTYALGLVLFECLTGRRAHQGQNAVDLMLRIVSAEAEPPSAHAPPGRRVPAHLDAACLRALAKDPWQRFESLREFNRALRSPEIAGPGPRPWRRIAVLASLALASVLLLGALTAIQDHARERAELRELGLQLKTLLEPPDDEPRAPAFREERLKLAEARHLELERRLTAAFGAAPVVELPERFDRRGTRRRLTRLRALVEGVGSRAVDRGPGETLKAALAAFPKDPELLALAVRALIRASRLSEALERARSLAQVDSEAGDLAEASVHAARLRSLEDIAPAALTRELSALHERGLLAPRAGLETTPLEVLGERLTALPIERALVLLSAFESSPKLIARLDREPFMGPILGERALRRARHGESLKACQDFNRALLADPDFQPPPIVHELPVLSLFLLKQARREPTSAFLLSALVHQERALSASEWKTFRASLGYGDHSPIEALLIAAAERGIQTDGPPRGDAIRAARRLVFGREIRARLRVTALPTLWSLTRPKKRRPRDPELLRSLPKAVRELLELAPRDLRLQATALELKQARQEFADGEELTRAAADFIGALRQRLTKVAKTQGEELLSGLAFHTLQNLCDMARRRNDRDESLWKAIQTLDRWSLELRPDQDDIRLRMATRRLWSGDVKAAVSLLDHPSIEESRLPVYLQVARLLQRGQTARARRLIESATKKGKLDPDSTRRCLILVLRAEGHEDPEAEALRMLQRR